MIFDQTLTKSKTQGENMQILEDTHAYRVKRKSQRYRQMYRQTERVKSESKKR